MTRGLRAAERAAARAGGDAHAGRGDDARVADVTVRRGGVGHAERRVAGKAIGAVGRVRIVAAAIRAAGERGAGLAFRHAPAARGRAAPLAGPTGPTATGRRTASAASSGAAPRWRTTATPARARTARSTATAHAAGSTTPGSACCATPGRSTRSGPSRATAPARGAAPAAVTAAAASRRTAARRRRAACSGRRAARSRRRAACSRRRAARSCRRAARSCRRAAAPISLPGGTRVSARQRPGEQRRQQKSASSNGRGHSLQTSALPGVTSNVRPKNDPVKLSPAPVPNTTVAFGAISVPLKTANMFNVVPLKPSTID